MRFPRRAKIGFDSKMNLHRAALKPTAAAFRQLRRLGNFCHAQNADEERARFLLLFGGHCQLHVINGEKFRSTFRDVGQCFLADANYFFGCGLAVGGTSPFKRRYIEAIP